MQQCQLPTYPMPQITAADPGCKTNLIPIPNTSGHLSTRKLINFKRKSVARPPHNRPPFPLRILDLSRTLYTNDYSRTAEMPIQSCVRRRHIMKSVFWVSFILIGASALQAQEFRGTIGGQITDPSNAVIAGARVTVTEVNTGTRLQVASEGTGQYTAPFLLPGDYNIEVHSA